ncbi:MAG: hypothetical protein JRD89_07785 [Deltaproteobacteria bacterium]|nr:hypothetical protein [Deltaproteobacteria bacterium]
MTVEFMAGFQILVDIALFLSIVFLIWAVSRERKRRPPEVDAQAFSEFKKLIEDSRNSSDHLFQALGEVKKIAEDLDEKERRLMTLAGEPNTGSKGRKTESATRGEKYEDVVKMAGQGLAEKEIADTLNLTEGEISLILNLHRKKNENPARRTSTS